MLRKDVGTRENVSRGPFLIIAAVAVVVLIAGVAYFFNSLDGGTLPEEPEPVIQPVPEPAPEPVEDLPEGVTYQQGQLRVNEAEILSVENGVISLKRGDDVLTVLHNPEKSGLIQKQVGPRFVYLSPSELELGLIVTALTEFVNGREVITGILIE